MSTEPPPTDPLTLPPEAVRALVGGDKIAAIKLVRAAHKVDLKTAKGVVDSYIELHPDIRTQIDSRRNQSRQGWIVWLVVAALIAWLILRWL
jgi:hypothetical protein